MKIILISLLSTIIFGMIDAMMFLFAEEDLQSQFNNIPFFDNNMSELLTGSISASVAIFISSIIKHKLDNSYDILEHPLIDVAGILIGTFIILALYKGAKNYIKGRVD
jgi:hypothetical protein